MYRCKICQVVSQPGQAQLKHTVYRPDKSILGEIPICPKCRDRLKTESVAQLFAHHVNRPAKTAVVKAEPQRLF